MTDEAGRQVIARAVAVLRALEQASPRGLTIADITRQSGLPRTTISRLVQALQAEQLVAQRAGRIRLGPALARFAAAAHLDVVGTVHPHLEALAGRVRETVDLWVERDSAVELVDEVTSTREVRIVAPVGTLLPLQTTAPGKVFLAQLADADVPERLRLASEPALERVVGDLSLFLQALQQTRCTGLGVDIEEHAEDVCAVAKVVELGRPERYAIAIPAPSRRFHDTRATLEAELVRCVQAIEAGG